VAQWLPFPDLHRAALAAVHAGLLPWPPAVPFLADGTPQQGSDVVSVATQTILGYGVLGVLALALAWITWKGSFVPQRRVDDLLAAARADLLRELESVHVELGKTQEQRDAAMKMATEQLVPLLTSFVATSQSLIPLLQELVRNRER
jgi:hypothetical protein